MPNSTNTEKSGVHLTGADSGWPTGNDATEPPYTKPGTGVDALPHASAVAGGVITDAGTDEVQLVTINGGPTGGTFTLKLGAGGAVTAGIGNNPTAAQVKAALVATADFDDADLDVTGATGGPFTVTFKGQYADKNVAALVATSSLTGGTTPAVVVSTSTPGAPR